MVPHCSFSWALQFSLKRWEEGYRFCNNGIRLKAFKPTLKGNMFRQRQMHCWHEKNLSVFIAVAVSCDAGSVASSLDIGGIA